MELTAIYITGSLSSFLKNHSQSVVVDGKSSEQVWVDSGVPQGTILGPMFLLHTNDLPDCVSSRVRLFADDCLLYRPIYETSDQLALQKDLDTPALCCDR